MSAESLAASIVQRLEDQKFEREIALSEALDERKRAYEMASLQYAYPYKALASIAVTVLSGFSAYRYKNLLNLIPIAIAVPYIAYETDACFGQKAARLQRRADLLYRKRLAEHEPHIMISDVKERLKELKERADME